MTDGKGGKDSFNYVVIVNETNDAPVFGAIGTWTVVEGTSSAYYLVATDEEDTDLTFAINETDVPDSDLTIVASSGKLMLNSDVNNGTYSVKLLIF